MEAYYNGVSLFDPSGLFLDNIDGYGADVDIYTAQTYGGGGSEITAQSVKSKEITIRLLLAGEADKELLHNVFLLKQAGVLTLGDKRIECVPQSVEVSYKAPFIATVVLLCPSPYFEAAQGVTTILSGTEDAWVFDWSFTAEDEFVFEDIVPVNSQELFNDGDVAVGCIFTVTVIHDASGIVIRNADTQEYMQFSVSPAAGSEYYIDTRTGHKSCSYKPIAALDMVQDFPGLLTWGSTFLQAAPGANRFYVTAAGGCDGINVSIAHTDLYSWV